MRTTVSFLIGAVFGATGVLMWVTETRATTRLEEGAVSASIPASIPVPGVTPASVIPSGIVPLQMPVRGVRPETLRRDFDQKRSGVRVHQALDVMKDHLQQGIVDRPVQSGAALEGFLNQRLQRSDHLTEHTQVPSGIQFKRTPSAGVLLTADGCSLLPAAIEQGQEIVALRLFEPSHRVRILK